MEDRIKILSSIDYEDLPGIYQQALMLVYPSIFEGFGIPIIEAMASGIPVVTSNTGCFPESAGDAGILVDPHNEKALTIAIRNILDDPAIAGQMVKKGKEHIRKFSSEQSAIQLHQLYESLISKR